jgi:hypothetical protein
MLSKKEVWEEQTRQMHQCGECALKPKDDFCPYIWCGGEIKMWPCDEYMHPIRDLTIGDHTSIEEAKVRVYRKSEKFKEPERPRRIIR